MIFKEKLREMEAPVFVFPQDQNKCKGSVCLDRGPLTPTCTDITCSFSRETDLRGSWEALLPCRALHRGSRPLSPPQGILYNSACRGGPCSRGW